MIAALCFLPVLVLSLAIIDALIVRRARHACPHVCEQCREDAYQLERWSQ